ncbi:unnamed protein product [Moneuplotes crassus]|uniref:Glutaredoxin domain-containing protein n=1 Tax=Euplotes crassus TaxID=5936 RepID=A0AAD2D8I3_EUPCR|nr:unnamed protein product [Moneuplotes crassus]
MGSSSSASPKTVDAVNSLIQKNKVLVFSKSYCPYCTDAKNVFTRMNVQPKVVELDQASNGSEIQSALYQITSQRTVPNIFINSKHVGGCDDLKAKARSGVVQDLLKEAGVEYI